MPKYVIEGGIDFYAELHHQPKQQPNPSAILGSANDTYAINDETKVCLLSKMPLEYGHITLPCKHVYNFMPLYNEVLSQKTNPELLKNVYHVKLSKNSIKCPYCRAIHVNALLPYIVGDKRVAGVNGPSTMCMDAPFKCQHSVMVSKSISGGRKKHAVVSECSAVKNIYCRRSEDAEHGDFKFLCKKHANLDSGTPKISKVPKNVHYNHTAE
jgi:hypothetical protein